ncbi:hypothetical protein HPP92_025441 [Vanilla planifolia]|uniref:RING-type E3 ubiquitin transferase n=1 Tax=Vanilla planifolia TaxID=51239 RepID=A0A835PQ37_VANPL|nr:hypothetical protein HPP92_025441 [Vanilla planifolia]
MELEWAKYNMTTRYDHNCNREESAIPSMRAQTPSLISLRRPASIACGSFADFFTMVHHNFPDYRRNCSSWTLFSTAARRDQEDTSFIRRRCPVIMHFYSMVLWVLLLGFCLPSFLTHSLRAGTEPLLRKEEAALSLKKSVCLPGSTLFAESFCPSFQLIFLLMGCVAIFNVLKDEIWLNGEIAKLCCGHVFHLGCIEVWLMVKNECPVCRASVVPLRADHNGGC